MWKLKRYCLVLFMCFQSLVMPTVSAGTAVTHDIHSAASDGVDSNHHHHNPFSLHADHQDSADSHVHAGDGTQTYAVVSQDMSGQNYLAGVGRLASRFDPPPDVFPEGLLRPPQTLL